MARPSLIEPLRALTRDLYFAGDLTLADVARVLRLTVRRVNRWSSRDGGWSAQRFRFQRGRAPAVDAARRLARRAVGKLQRGGLARGEAARALLVQVAAVVLEDDAT